MQIKMVHDIMKKFSENYTRNMSFSGSAIRNVYKFNGDTPYLNNRAVVAYTSNQNANVDKSENVVYDYSSLLQAETLDDINKFQCETRFISDLSVTEYEDIVRKNTVVAQHMKDLEQQIALLKEIEGI